MEDRNLRELQSEIEMLKARLAEVEGRPTTRLRRPPACLPSSRRARLALVASVLVVATASYAAVPYTFVNGTIADATQVNANFANLDSRLAALEAKTQCMTQVADEVYFTGCNVNIRDGSGDTDGAVNGLGNLIVGYNENNVSATRTGSHNLVVGIDHEYTSFGGSVAGAGNWISGEFSSVSGGAYYNTASGDYSSVGGGNHNTASGDYSSVGGGSYNEASGYSSSVSGGYFNEAAIGSSSVSGGRNNTAGGLTSSVSGGNGRTAGGQDDWVAGALWQDN